MLKLSISFVITLCYCESTEDKEHAGLHVTHTSRTYGVEIIMVESK
jgi:hypothetical protein